MEVDIVRAAIKGEVARLEGQIKALRQAGRLLEGRKPWTPAQRAAQALRTKRMWAKRRASHGKGSKPR